jgi:ribonuclease BN (tRNA processing enzyme)
MALRLRRRWRPLRIVASGPTLAWAQQLLDLGYPGSFAPEKCFPIELVAAEALAGAAGDGASFVGPPPPAWLADLRCAIAPTRHKVANHAVRLEHERGAVVISGDGAPTDASIALWRGADLVIHECHADAPARAGAGHADLDALLVAARRVGLRRMALVHVDDAHRDRVEAGVRQAIAARDAVGLELHLPRPGATLRVTPR